MDSTLDIQVGGNHYKDLQMQPIVLITKANCDFIQGCIIKYISRYKNKNGKQAQQNHNNRHHNGKSRPIYEKC